MAKFGENHDRKLSKYCLALLTKNRMRGTRPPPHFVPAWSNVAARATGNSRSGIPRNSRREFPGILRNLRSVIFFLLFHYPVSLPFTTNTECKLQRIKY